MALGIRSYGPGKFYTVIDSYAYEVTLDGGADEEESYEGGGGWYGLLWLDEPTRNRINDVALESNDRLTEEEDDLLDESVAIIFFERSDGIVEADWYETKREAEAMWSDIQADAGEYEGEGEEEEDDEDEDEEDD